MTSLILNCNSCILHFYNLELEPLTNVGNSGPPSQIVVGSLFLLKYIYKKYIIYCTYCK